MANVCFLFREDVEKVKSSGDWKAVHDFYLTTFESFPELNAAFKVITYKTYFPLLHMTNLPLFLSNIDLYNFKETCLISEFIHIQILLK